jgi:hypothetical protein
LAPKRSQTQRDATPRWFIGVLFAPAARRPVRAMLAFAPERLGHAVSAASDAGLLPALLARELSVTEVAIARNPKSYHAWHHRQWSVSALGGGAAFAALSR